MSLTQVPSSQINDGTIKDADIASDANITLSKINGAMSNPMTTAGDMIYGGTSGVPTRLPKGTANQVLAMNAGATAPEWKTVPSAPATYIISVASDFSIANNGDITSAGAIAGSVTLPAGSYKISGVMKYLSAAGGYKLRVTSGTESNVMTCQKHSGSGAGVNFNNIVADQSTYIINHLITFGTTTYKGEVSGVFTLGAEATVNLRFCQNSSNAAASILYANSFIYFEKVA